MKKVETWRFGLIFLVYRGLIIGPVIGLVMGVALWCVPETVLAADIPADSVVDVLETAELARAIEDMAAYLSEMSGQNVVLDFWERVRAGEFSWDVDEMLRLPLLVLAGEVAGSARILGQMLVLSVFSLLLTQLSPVGGGAVASLGRSVVWLVLLGCVLPVFDLAEATARGALDVMSAFVYALLPVLLTLLASLGVAGAVGMFHPVVLAVLSISLHTAESFVLPLLEVCGALTIGGFLAPGCRMSGLAKLCRDVAMGVFGVMLTLFSAVLGLVGLSGAVAGSLGIKAIKSASGAFIPVIGRTLADALDTVIGTSLLIKNSIGVLGLMLLLLVCALPAIKILVLALLFRVAGGLSEPLGDERLAAAYNALAGVVMLFFAVTAAAGIFFFFVVSITIAMGNVGVAIR